MPLYRVRVEETEQETTTSVSYATFHVDPLDDPKQVFRMLDNIGALKWIRAEDEDDWDIDTTTAYSAPEYVGEDGSTAETPVHGKPEDYGLRQLMLA